MSAPPPEKSGVLGMLMPPEETGRIKAGKEEQLLLEHLSPGTWQALKNICEETERERERERERQCLTIGSTIIHGSQNQLSTNLPSQYRWEYMPLQIFLTAL